MKLLWDFSCKISSKPDHQKALFLFFNILLCCTIGFFIWYLQHFFAFATISSALCLTGFAGYFIGFCGGVLYLARHTF